MALLETYPVGTTVKIAENGTLAEYLIVHIGLPDSMYDVSCDGIWMLRKDIFEKRQWHSSNVNDWANSTLKAYLDSTFLNRFDANVKNAIKPVKIPYRPGSGTSMSVSSGVNGLSCKVFLLSDREVGYTQSNANQYIVNDGAKLDYFQDGNGTSEKIAHLNGSVTVWWLRSPHCSVSSNAWVVLSNGDSGSGNCAGDWGVRPAFILPYNRILVNDDGTLTVKPPATLGELGVKDKVTFGTYYNAPIVWDVGDKNHVGYPDNSVTLVSSNILKLCCFDAMEPKNNYVDRMNRGNNRYALSNLRQWLNSDAPAGQWFTYQHSADAPPTNANVFGNYNRYDDEMGFLNAFTTSEQTRLLPTTLTVAKSTIDSGGSETVQDRIFLLSKQEVGFGSENGIVEGTLLPLFNSDNTSRQRMPTAQAVSNSEYTNSSFSESQYWYYWLRSPYATYASNVLYMSSGGSLSNDYAYRGYGGVLPACNLSADTPIIPLADGTYAVILTMPKTTGDLPVGALVNAPFADGTSKQCIAVNQGIPEDSALYDVSCNGTWMQFNDLLPKHIWAMSGVNQYALSDIVAYLNGDFSALLSDEFRACILQIKIPYCDNHGNGVHTIKSGTDGLPTLFFLASARELGFTASQGTAYSADGAKWQYYNSGDDAIARSKRIAFLSGNANAWSTRSVNVNTTKNTAVVLLDGSIGMSPASAETPQRPAFILPPDLPVEMQEDGSFNIVPNKTSARKIVDGVELPAASLKTVNGIDLECDCYKIIDGIELVCT